VAATPAAGGSWTSKAHAYTRAVTGRLNAPRPALVETRVDGSPARVDREAVTVVREEWRVVDRWWTDEPVDRRYYEVVLESGRNTCVFLDREHGRWFTQRA
jgi:hypothetical protein